MVSLLVRRVAGRGCCTQSWKLALCRTAATDNAEARHQAFSASPDDSKTEPWMQHELELYFKSRKRLAEMVGADVDHFTDSDVEDALRYLLPTQLTARDARPSLKHPTKIFPERKEAAFDGDGRPLDPGFYTGAPAFHGALYNIYLHSKVLGSVVGESPQSTKPSHWLKREVLSNILAEELTEAQYEDMISRLNKLSSHPSLSKDSATQRMLLTYQSKSLTQTSADTKKPVESGGCVQTVGRRKTSTAVVRLYSGSGTITVNKVHFVEYFSRPEDRQQVLYPLIITKSLADYDINVSVHGGGLTGQSGAVRLAVSKALAALGKEGLEKRGLLNRDPRSVERKKPGQKKARKKFTWVKR